MQILFSAKQRAGSGCAIMPWLAALICPLVSQNGRLFLTFSEPMALLPNVRAPPLVMILALPFSCVCTLQKSIYEYRNDLEHSDVGGQMMARPRPVGRGKGIPKASSFG